MFLIVLQHNFPLIHFQANRVVPKILPNGSRNS